MRHFKKSRGVFHARIWLKYKFVYTYKRCWSVARICQVLGLSRSGYYNWLRQREKRKLCYETYLLVKIKEGFEASRRTYGSRRIAAELRAEGIRIGKNKVAAIMREYGIIPKTKRRYKVTTNSKHRLPIAMNLLREAPRARALNQVWVADITYIWTREGWL